MGVGGRPGDPERDGAPVDPVRRMLEDAATGTFPRADGAVEVLRPPAGRADAVIGFTAHHVVAADLDPEEVRAQLDPDDVAAAMRAPFLTWLGHRLGAAPGMLDLVLVAWNTADSVAELEPLEEPVTSVHPRVHRALDYRDDVAVYTDSSGHGTVIMGRGLAGRREVSIEVAAVARGRGLGRSLARSATSLVAADEPLFAQVSPGNVASLRAFLAAGFRPVASEVLFLRGR